MPLFGRAGSPFKIMWPGQRPTSVPSGILIHPAIWPQHTWAKNWGSGGCAPFQGELGPYVCCDPEGAQQPPPTLWPISFVDKWLDGSRFHFVHCVRWGPSSPYRKGHSSLPPFSKFMGARIIRGPCLLWPNGWMDQDETWHGDRPRPSPNCVKWQPSSLPKGAQPLNFRPCLLWPNGWMDKMQLGTEVGLGLDQTVLDGDPAPFPQRGTAPSNFRPIPVLAKRLDGSRYATWYGDWPRLWPHCVRWGPNTLLRRGTALHF